jgi:hypothetical protein
MCNYTNNWQGRTLGIRSYSIDMKLWNVLTHAYCYRWPLQLRTQVWVRSSQLQNLKGTRVHRSYPDEITYQLFWNCLANRDRAAPVTMKISIHDQLHWRVKEWVLQFGTAFERCLDVMQENTEKTNRTSVEMLTQFPRQRILKIKIMSVIGLLWPFRLLSHCVSILVNLWKFWCVTIINPLCCCFLNVPKNVCTNVTQVQDINIYISYSKPFVTNIINCAFVLQCVDVT